MHRSSCSTSAGSATVSSTSAIASETDEFRSSNPSPHSVARRAAFAPWTQEDDVAKLIYSAIASLDGYVEDAEGGFEWAAPDEEVHAFVNDLERSVGTYLYGRR